MTAPTRRVVRRRWDLRDGLLLDVLECGHEVEQTKWDRNRSTRECSMCEAIANIIPKPVDSSASGDSAVINMLHREAAGLYDRVQRQDEEIARLRKLVRDLGGEVGRL